MLNVPGSTWSCRRGPTRHSGCTAARCAPWPSTAATRCSRPPATTATSSWRTAWSTSEPLYCMPTRHSTAPPPQRPAAEPAAGAAEAAGGPGGGGRAVRAGRALAPRAALAPGRRRRPHAAPLRVGCCVNHYWASYIAALQYNTYNNKYTYDNTALYSLSLLIPVYFQFLRCLRGATEILILRLLQ